MKYFTLLVLMFFVSNVYAQETSTVRYNTEHKNHKIASEDSTKVRGRLLSNEIKKRNIQSIYRAIAMFYDKKDSKMVLNGEYSDSENLHIGSCYTEENGTFEIKLPYGEYLYEFTSIGYKMQFGYITLNTKILELGDVVLKPYSCNFDDEIKVTRIKWRDRK